MTKTEALSNIVIEWDKYTVSKAGYQRCKRSLKALDFTPSEAKAYLIRMGFDQFVSIDAEYKDVAIGVKEVK